MTTLIHEDFLTYNEKAIENHIKKYDLKKYGFSQDETEALSEREIAIVESYDRIGLKFLTESQLEFLCFKHDLFWSGVKYFTGIVPQINGSEIIKFCEETVEDHSIGLAKHNDTFDREDDTNVWITKDANVINISTMSNSHLMNVINKLKHKELDFELEERFKRVCLEAFYRGLFNNKIDTTIREYIDEAIEEEEDIGVISPRDALVVAATREFFKPNLITEGDSRRLKLNEFSRTRTNRLERESRKFAVDDPIVLAKVKEGYLIVTYWDIKDPKLK